VEKIRINTAVKADSRSYTVRPGGKRAWGATYRY